ncbi:TRAFAC clade GTPase domain-containing protein [Microbacterium algeriense]|uniref:TRAFAC clade GTPase domain-containing protein n=1 Tax=Microbacterium algeriense TaxID=2615184 RepID=UPI0029A865F7|nr:ATP/GTP-binding protein [Microbacterium algeriense]MDX2401411.1 ATP/GTP-binding protein [Microbacterium algeriense]
MQEKKSALEQHIAVFGGSGSGKTVLVSSFYGAAQEASFLKQSLYRVVAEDIGQGARLNRNYLGMRDEARAPDLTRFAATSYAFSIKLKEQPSPKASKAQPFHALRLVWHDYPGDWFEQGASGEEARRRVDTFRSLLGSDVALLLVDGQRLLDHAGEEERYLKSLFSNYANGLLALKDDLLDEGTPLLQFPRIWIVALSKADLLPHIDVFKFRDLLDLKAADDLDELRKVLAGFAQNPSAMSVAEDFLLLSSAKFEPNKIEVDKRVGIDLVLPVAALLPLERHAKWARFGQLPTKVAEGIINGGSKLLATALLGKQKKGKLGAILALLSPDVIDEAAQMAGDKVRELNAQALAKHNFVTATLTQFQMDLNKGEEDDVFLRSLT